MASDRPNPAAVPATHPFTVGALLAHPALHGARLLAGPAGLDRPISWCLPWAELAAGSEAVDGVVVHARVTELAEPGTARRVASLADRGAAALLLSGDAGLLPADLRSALGGSLPAVQLPATAGFALTNRVVAEGALAQAAHVLEYGVTVHRTLAELLHRGAGLSALGRQLSVLSRSPAFILDPLGKVLAYEYLGTTAVPDPSEVVRLLSSVDVIGAPERGGEAPPRVQLVVLALEDQRVTCVVGPIVLGRKHLGSLVIVELDPRPDDHELARHRVIVEQATTIAGSELLRLRSVEEATERARGDFVHALLHGRFASPHDLASRAAHHDFDLDARYAVVTAHGFNLLGSANSPATMLSLARQAEKLLRRGEMQTLATVVDDVLAVIRQVPAEPGGAAQAAEYADALAQQLQRDVGRALTVTYGRGGNGASGISASYREARIALGVCDRLNTSRVAGYAELRVFAALSDIAGSAQGRAFAGEMLAPLRSDRGGDDLERAVVAYLESGGNLNATARRLALHRNTMLYKLDRAARLLGMDLREADNQFTLWLAHRIDLLGRVQAAVDQDLRMGT